jgi:hypothetical protein
MRLVVVGTARERGSKYECVRVIPVATETYLRPVGPFIAFASPIDKAYPKKRTTTPDRPLRDVIDYFKEEGVQLVVRLNEKLYDGAVFEEQGMKHAEMVRRSSPFPDSTAYGYTAITALSRRLESARGIRQGIHQPCGSDYFARWKGCGAL